MSQDTYMILNLVISGAAAVGTISASIIALSLAIAGSREKLVISLYRSQMHDADVVEIDGVSYPAQHPSFRALGISVTSKSRVPVSLARVAVCNLRGSWIGGPTGTLGRLDYGESMRFLVALSDMRPYVMNTVREKFGCYVIVETSTGRRFAKRMPGHLWDPPTEEP